MFSDALTLDAPRTTRDGYLAVRAKAARVGTYVYDGAEIDPNNEHGLRDAGPVNVLRDENTVFDEAAARSFIGKPVTDDHPSSPVNASNWRDVARGMVMGAMRDGDYLAFDLLLTDAGVIQKIADGKRELSNGYGATLEFGDFTAADGTKAVARQTSISGNHVALVDQGRAGSACRVADAAICDAATVEIAGRLLDEIMTDGRTYSGSPNPNKNVSTNSGGSPVATKTITFDGLPVETTDAAEAVINKQQGQIAALTADKAKAEGDLAKLATDKATLEAKVVTLEQQVKDAKLTPQQLRDAAKAFAHTLDVAKKLVPAATFTDTMDESEIKRSVVTAKLGDAAKNWTDEQTAVSFETLAAQIKDGNVDPVRNVLSGAVPQNIGDAKAEYQAARDKARQNLSDGWKTPSVAAA